MGMYSSMGGYGASPLTANNPVNAMGGAGAFKSSPVMPGNPAGGGEISWLDKLLGYQDGEVFNPGYLKTGVDVVGGIGNLYLGMKQYGLAKDQFAENKRQYNQNFEVQKNLTNSQLEDRQRGRLAAQPNAGNPSLSEYMSKYGVK